MKTIPVTPVLHTASGSLHTPVSVSYQPSSVTLALVKAKDTDEQVSLLVKPSAADGEQPVSSPTVTSGMAEALHYVAVRGNHLHNVYVPAPPGFQIPVSG